MEFLGYRTDTRVEQSVVALPVMCKVIDDMCIIELHDIISHLSQIQVILFRFHRFQVSSFAIHHMFRSYVLLLSHEQQSLEDVILWRLCRVVSFFSILPRRRDISSHPADC